VVSGLDLEERVQANPQKLRQLFRGLFHGGVLPGIRQKLFHPSELAGSRRLYSIWRGYIFEHARCEVLGENGAKNGSGKHQHQDHVEQAAIDQALTGGVESIVGDERSCECRRHLWQRE
jgi:hypothetical protein